MGYRSFVDPDYRIQKSSEAQQVLSNKLIREISNFSKKEGAPTSEGTITYELFYAPDQAKAAQHTKLVEMEKRLYALECTLGLNKDDLVSGTQNAKDLLQTVEDLREKLNLLTGLPSKSQNGISLEQLERKLIAATQQMEALQKKVANPTKETHEKKVNDIYEMMIRWDSVAKTLPAVVQRLQFLKTVHDSAASFTSSLEQLEQKQAEISKSVKANETILSTVSSY